MALQKTEPPKRKGKIARRKETITDLRGLPSPSPTKRRRPERGGAGDADGGKVPGPPSWNGPPLEEVERLAGRGLTLEQILVQLEWEGELTASQRVRVEAAVKKGRALGSSAIKQAHYEAAINGRVSAQSHMLSILEDEENGGEEEETEFVVVRQVIGEAQEEGD